MTTIIHICNGEQLVNLTSSLQQITNQGGELNPARVSNQDTAKVNNSSVGKASSETEAVSSETLTSICHSHETMRHEVIYRGKTKTYGRVSRIDDSIRIVRHSSDSLRVERN